MCVCMCVRMYVCMCVYVRMYVWVCVCVCVCVCACMCVCVCVCVAVMCRQVQCTVCITFLYILHAKHNRVLHSHIYDLGIHKHRLVCTCTCMVAFQFLLPHNFLVTALYNTLGEENHFVSNHSCTCWLCCHILLFFRLSTCC